MIYELSQQFYFEAAHTLEREVDADASRRIHGHTYQAEVTLRGLPEIVSICSMIFRFSLMVRRLLDTAMRSMSLRARRPPMTAEPNR